MSKYKKIILFSLALILLISGPYLYKRRYYPKFLIYPYFVKAADPIEKEDQHFCIVSPGYNIKKEVIRSIKSVVDQKYKNWTMYVVNDKSTDNTAEIAEKYIKENKLDDKVKLISNEVNQQALLNYIINFQNKCSEDDVLVVLDADDYLYHPHVLSKLYHAYKDPEVWMAYTNQVHKRGYKFIKSTGYDEQTNKDNSFRKWPTIIGHLKSFRGWLFNKANLQEEYFNNNKYVNPNMLLSDYSIVVPLAEMATDKHIRIVDDYSYMYDNKRSSTTVKEFGATLQYDMQYQISASRRFSPIEDRYSTISFLPPYKTIKRSLYNSYKKHCSLEVKLKPE